MSALGVVRDTIFEPPLGSRDMGFPSDMNTDMNNVIFCDSDTIPIRVNAIYYKDSRFS